MTPLPRAGALLALALASCATTPDAAYLRQYDAAEKAGRPFAPVTDTQPAMTVAEAYRLQQRIVQARLRRGDRVAGYKGGLMSAASLRQRGVTEPLVGVLFASGRTATGAAVSLCGYRKASFELKLGFQFARSVPSNADLATLRGAVGAVMPVIDLPDIGYRDPDKYGAADMVAANVSAAKWIAGSSFPTASADLDTLSVSLARGGQRLASGVGRESLDGQWQSLAAVVRQIGATSRQLKPGDIVITGRIGDRGWLPPGDYRADYGPLGVIPFTVAACGR